MKKRYFIDVGESKPILLAFDSLAELAQAEREAKKASRRYLLWVKEDKEDNNEKN